MSYNFSKIKEELERQLNELRLKRKNIIILFKQRLEKEKIQQIKNSILGE